MRKLIDRAFDTEKVVIFGLRDLAQLAQYYFNSDPAYFNYIISGFTVSKEYMTEEAVKTAKQTLKYDLPIVAWETIEQVFPPEEFKLFCPLTATRMNSFRERIFNEGKAKGYKFVNLISSDAVVETDEIGENCWIQGNNYIQAFSKIGNNVILWGANWVGHHSTIADHVFITSEVCVSGHCTIKNNCYLGVNSTVIDSITLAESTLVGAGALMTKNVDEPFGLYMGVPAERRTKSSLAVL